MRSGAYSFFPVARWFGLSHFLHPSSPSLPRRAWLPRLLWFFAFAPEPSFPRHGCSLWRFRLGWFACRSLARPARHPCSPEIYWWFACRSLARPARHPCSPEIYWLPVAASFCCRLSTRWWRSFFVPGWLAPQVLPSAFL